MSESQSKSFEQGLKRLEQIVRQLEGGAPTLEESIQLFQEGTQLVSGCNQLLDQAEREITKLTKGPNGTIREVPFDRENPV